MRPYRNATRALSALDPEFAHAAAIGALAFGLGPRAAVPADPVLRVRLAGIDLPHPVGLAAGFDKDARAPAALLRAGFAFVECGTVTPKPQSGAPRPRVFRLRPDASVINRLGFNNQGVHEFVRRLAKRAPGPVGANIGANRDSPDRIADYVAGYEAVYPVATYVTVNVSSPNTPGLRDLQAPAALADLLGRLSESRAALARDHGARPLFLKIAPDLEDGDLADIADLAAAARVDGVIVSNTTKTRPEALEGRHRNEAGGLSGRALFALSTERLRAFAYAAAGRFALVGAGGVECGATALAKIKAGASAVQLYTAMIYEGPDLPARIARDLAARLKAEGFSSVAEAVGADLR